MTGELHDANAHLDAICEDAGLGVMRGIFQVIQDRERADDRTLLALTAEDVYELYELHVGRAVDKIEDSLLGEAR